LMWSL